MRGINWKKWLSGFMGAVVIAANMPMVSYATEAAEVSDLINAVAKPDEMTNDGEDEVVTGQKGSLSEDFAWETLVPQTPAEGNVMVGFSGAYYVETAETILARINAIRLEACKEGVKDPNTGKTLTEADYKPLKWSSDLEAISRLRAAEATIKMAHERPNGERCFSIVTTNNEQSWAENLAWNNTGLMQGIEQFYEEKADWVNNNTSAVTGHYESMISTRYNYVAMGCFRLSSGGWYGIAQEFSFNETLDEQQDMSKGECVQSIEVPISKVKSVKIGDAETLDLQAGTTSNPVLNSVVSFEDYYGDAKNYNTVIQSGATWSSSDTSVATVDEKGCITALKSGTTTIQASVGSLSDTITVKVAGEAVIYHLDTDAVVTLTQQEFAYNGKAQEPAVTVKVGDTELSKDKDYTVTYVNNQNVGTATVTVSGLGCYQGSKSVEFRIVPAKLTITAKDVRIRVGETLPAFTYKISGLAAGEKLVTEPTFSCSVTDLSKAGEYEIVPGGATASANYDSNITYVSGKLIVSEETLSIREIEDVYYTGKACKPTVQLYDEGLALKVNKDYKVTYFNNINANSKQKTGNGMGVSFDKNLPYVQIVGNGNYSGTLIQMNFNILPVMIGEGDSNAAKGFTVKTNSQLVVNANKAMNPFVSVKGPKAMKKNVDYTIRLSVLEACDAKGVSVAEGTVFGDGMIPAGYSGAFLLEIMGKGNYCGSICTEIYVADKNHLIKNATVKIGKNLKKQSYSEQGVTLAPGYYDSASGKYYAVEGGNVTNREVSADDVFTVSFGETGLIYQKDFTVRYKNNDCAGKATIIIEGVNNYVGTKAVPFQIVGESFSAKTVQIQGLENKTYTGDAVVQNQLRLTCNGKVLEQGKHYTVSYKNNIKKGTATITFTAISKSGYQGKFSKTFKILAADLNYMIQSAGMKQIAVEYTKAGATPWKQVSLTHPTGGELVYNKDYTVSYRNNKLVAKATDSVAPAMIIKGKGNYTGSIEVPFTITQGDLSNANITKTSAFVQFQAGKAANTEYRPQVTVMDGKNRLSQGTDYAITYINNTQEKCALYLENFKKGTATEAERPKAIITAVEGSCYKLTAPVEIPLIIYETKLSSKNIHVVVDEASYTGSQVTPEVSVYFHEDSKVVAQARNLTDEKLILALGLRKLDGDTDYFLTYGANVTAGKNKGSVKVSGAGPLYGGNVTVKFTINGKKIVW